MTRLPSIARSRAVLIGTSTHLGPGGLHDLPAVDKNLTDLGGELTDPETGTFGDHCEVIRNPSSPGEIGAAVRRAAAAATDVLFVYYSGHGLVDDRGRLHLALSTTDPAQPRWTALSFDVLREEIADSDAAVRILVLDCCFSGRAIHAMADTQGVITGQIDIAGTYTITSTSADATSHAPVGAAYTSFTEALLSGLRNPEPLTLDHLFVHMRGHLISRGLPRPQRRQVDTAGGLTLARQAPVRTPPGPMTPAGPPGPVLPAPAPLGEPTPPRPPARTESVAPPPQRRGTRRTAERPAASPGREPADPVGSTATRFLVLVATCLPVFLVVLDLLIGPRTLEAIQESQALSLDGLRSVLYVYLAPLGSLMLLACLRGGPVRQRALFTAGLTVFAAASFVCAVASGPALLVLGRLLQGAGAALLLPHALRLATRALPVRMRWTVIGLWAAAAVTAALLSDVLCGLIADDLSWRWVFLINVPVCVLSLLLARLLPRERVVLGPFLLQSGVGAGALAAGGLVIGYGSPFSGVANWGCLLLLLGGAVTLALAVRERAAL